MTDIAKLLKDCPAGTKLYSPLFGEVEFAEVMDTGYMPIRVMKRGYGIRFDKYGRYMGNEYPDAECLLFPSKDCRTWEGRETPVEPKFKVGDKVLDDMMIVTVREVVYDKNYKEYKYGIGSYWVFESALKPYKPHYDIKNFKPFDKVLVRGSNERKWVIDFYGFVDEDIFICTGCGYYPQCIPFNDDTKHLLGTSDMCSEEFINW